MAKRGRPEKLPISAYYFRGRVPRRDDKPHLFKRDGLWELVHRATIETGIATAAWQWLLNKNKDLHG